jgi:biotin carboxylase
VYHPFSFGVAALAAAAEGLCEMVWVVDSSMADVELMTNLLRRLGRVVDVRGLSEAQAAERIAQERPDGILALADSLLLWTARVAALLGLPFHSPEVAARLADKYLQRTALAAAGLPGPAFRALGEQTDDAAWEALGGEIGFPALLKPRHGDGSRDIVAAASPEEARAQAAALGPHEGGLLIEEYLPGRRADAGADFAGYVSVESIVSAGRVSHLATTGRTPPAEPFRESGFFVPSALEGAELASVFAAASEAIAAIGVTIGGLHTEIKLTPQGPRVIELNGRVGGGTPAMLAAVTGVDELPLTMRIALGEAVAFERPLACRAVSYVLYRHAPASMRRVLAVEGLERLREEEGVEQVILNRGPGQRVDWREGNWGHVFSVHGTVPDHERLRAFVRRIAAETRIVGE